MQLTLIKDINESGAMTWSSENPRPESDELKFIVDGLTELRASAKKLQAHNFVKINIGDRNSTTNFLTVQSKTTNLIDTNKALVVVKYGKNDTTVTSLNNTLQANVEISSTLQSGDTNKDWEGKPLSLSQAFDLSKPTLVTTFNARANKSISSLNLKISQVEQEFPGDKAIEYVGTINKGNVPWIKQTLINPGDPGDNVKLTDQESPKVWRCNSISASASNFNLPWQVNYEFQLNLPDWDVEVQFEKDGQVPNDLVEGVGIKRFEVYDQKNYMAMGIRL